MDLSPFYTQVFICFKIDFCVSTMDSCLQYFFNGDFLLHLRKSYMANTTSSWIRSTTCHWFNVSFRWRSSIIVIYFLTQSHWLLLNFFEFCSYLPKWSGLRLPPWFCLLRFFCCLASTYHWIKITLSAFIVNRKWNHIPAYYSNFKF